MKKISMQSPGSSFLHDRNPQVHTSDEVETVVGYLRQGGEAIPNEPADKISAHLGFLANREYVNDGILTGDQGSIDRQIDAHVIKAEDVPEGYFELQRRIAREQGHGDIQITSEMRHQMVEAVQADQRAGLGKWVEYLGGDDGGYPDWFKHYIWSSITKLGTFDKEKSEFQKRSRGTTAPYPELNREALAYVYDVLNKSRVQGEKVDGGANNADLQRLLKGGNLGKLYAHAVLEVTPDSPELRNEVRGSWTKFDQTDDPRTARRLSGSLQGHGTGWCTAGESTASIQLSGGDFFVYYTRDEDGKDTVPRVAIRMEQGEVAEVRGVNAAQELEPEMADLTAERLKELPGGEEYIRKAEDMKRLTAIEKKIQEEPETELTSEEVRFLYELDREIQGFGYERDPRIDEIRQKRRDKGRVELSRIVPEVVREQLKGAYKAYSHVAEQLFGAESVILWDELDSLFNVREKEWQKNGVYEYLVEQLMEKGGSYYVVVTPNAGTTEQDIISLAQAFSPEKEASISDNLLGKGLYSGSELSGKSGNAAVRFSLISGRLDSSFTDKASEQRNSLSKIQSLHPELGARVPSMLDAVIYWYTLRAQSVKLDDDNTYIRHFDLEPVDSRRGPSIPRSYVEDDGQPGITGVYCDVRDHARLAFG
jgi:hypothetical protein